MIGLLVMFTEVCNQLIIWAMKLIETLNNRPFNNHQRHSKELELFTQTLEKTNNTFSSVLFVLISAYLISLVFAFYSVLSFVLDKKSSHFNLFPFIIFLVVNLRYFNILSCDLTKTVHQLKRAILRSGIEFECKSYIIEELQCFQGFDAHGFFTLNRPLLTSIISNFTTFIIVLIQFKMSENPGSETQQSMNCSCISNYTYN
jgi:hypothetical protein